MNIITIKNLVKKFPVGKSYFTALDNINLDFGKAEFAGLVGPSGSGKTTLLNILGSLDTPTEGLVEVMGKSISDLTHKESARLSLLLQAENLAKPMKNIQIPLKSHLIRRKGNKADGRL